MIGIRHGNSVMKSIRFVNHSIYVSGKNVIYIDILKTKAHSLICRRVVSPEPSVTALVRRIRLTYTRINRKTVNNSTLTTDVNNFSYEGQFWHLNIPTRPTRRHDRRDIFRTIFG